MNNLLSQLTEVQKSINPNYIPSEEPRYIIVIKQLEARNKSSVRKEYSKSNPLSGMVEDLIDAGVLQDNDARFLSDKEIRALHEKMHDGILEAAGMGHFEPAEEMADEMLSDEVQMASNGVCRQDTGDGVDYIEDGLGMSEFDEVQMAEPKEGQKKPIFGRMYEYKSGKWTPIEGGATAEEPKEEEPTAEEPMDDDEALSAMVEEKGAMIDEMLAGGMSPEEIADELGKEETTEEEPKEEEKGGNVSPELTELYNKRSSLNFTLRALQMQGGGNPKEIQKVKEQLADIESDIKKHEQDKVENKTSKKTVSTAKTSDYSNPKNVKEFLLGQIKNSGVEDTEVLNDLSKNYDDIIKERGNDTRAISMLADVLQSRTKESFPDIYDKISKFKNNSGKEDTDIPSNERIDAEIEAHAILSDDPGFREYAESTLGRSMTDEEFDEYTANYISDMSDEEIAALGTGEDMGEEEISDEEIRDMYMDDFSMGIDDLKSNHASAIAQDYRELFEDLTEGEEGELTDEDILDSVVDMAYDDPEFYAELVNNYLVSDEEIRDREDKKKR